MPERSPPAPSERGRGEPCEQAMAQSGQRPLWAEISPPLLSD